MSAWSVPGYTEVQELGRGASGRVVLATHQQTGIPVAIKYLADNLQQDEIFLRAFRASARILSAFAAAPFPHPSATRRPTRPRGSGITV